LFCLLNMLSGPSSDGIHRKILFPLMPEYIGYADQGVFPGSYRAARPRIEQLEDRQFKYHVDFDALELGADTGAICVSRPTNPTGNVLSDQELRRLVDLAAQRDIPVIIDNAYGNPFPGIMFSDSLPAWDVNTILTFSLSKLGLPGTRTGMVVGPPMIVRALESMNSVLSLATGNIGQIMLTPLLESGELISLVDTVIRPFYRERSLRAQEWLRQYLPADLDYRYHRCEGSMFLWLWFRDLPVTTRELYERLKRRGVLVLPGEFFFFGLDEPWAHRDQCIRMHYAHDMDAVQQGIRILADELAGLRSAG
jgi:valine--pyruvate aminotransferase